VGNEGMFVAKTLDDINAEICDIIGYREIMLNPIKTAVQLSLQTPSSLENASLGFTGFNKGLV
jgi:hypothetical protein